jgi:uncharacterized protein (TIGR02145 family)
MKKLNPFIFLAFSSILVLVSPECTRDSSTELIKYGRYTDKYLGSWDFRYISKTTNSTTGEESTDTVFFTGVINTGTGNGGLVIQYTEQLNMSLRVGYDGVMIDKCMQPTSCHGEFTGDNVFHYNLTSRVFTGQSFVYYNKTIDGKKISGESSLNKAPLVSTDPPSGIAMNGAKLNGSVVANYLSTNVSFEYGPTASYGNSAIASPGPLTGNKKTAVDAYVSGLTPETEYHFRTKAVNSLGTAYGGDSVFITKSLTDNVYDNEGNLYKTIQIDDQLWMAENLRSKKFQNGDEIPTTKITMQDVSEEAEPKYQWVYDGAESYSNLYGRLYTWYVVADDRNICPEGWHVPSYSEVNILINSIDQNNGGALKEAGLSHWKSPNTGATNATGFSGLPGGMAFINFMIIQFNGIGDSGNWWTSSGDTGKPGSDSRSALAYCLFNNGSTIIVLYGARRTGYSVRCIKNR